MKDPIYNDLVKEYSNAQSNVEKDEKKLVTLEKDLFKSQIRTIERKSAQKDIDNTRMSLRKHQQEAEYYRIAIIQREVEARAQYKRAFAADKEWPDKKEFESYQQTKKMRSVSRNWSERVPKPINPLSESASGEKKATTGAEDQESAEGEAKSGH